MSGISKVSEDSVVPEGSVILTPGALADLYEKFPGLADAIRLKTEGEVDSVLCGASTPESLSSLYFKTLGLQHGILLNQGKSSSEIFDWMRTEGIITGELQGEFGAFPLVNGDLPETFHKFMETIMGDKYNRLANTRRILTPQEIEEGGIQEPDDMEVAKLDGYVWDALFGPENMKKAGAHIIQIDDDWKNMIQRNATDEEKIAYLNEKTGIKVKIAENGKWILTGIRGRYGKFVDPNLLFVSGGGFVDGGVQRLMLNCDGGNVISGSNASFARLGFLADTL